jgi:hypothetical protein
MSHSREQEACPPAPGEVVTHWREVEWTEAQELRLARLLFGHLAEKAL